MKVGFYIYHSSYDVCKTLDIIIFVSEWALKLKSSQFEILLLQVEGGKSMKKYSAQKIIHLNIFAMYLKTN